MPTCPSRTSSHTVKNGRIHNGKQRFKCHECGRQFIERPTKKVIDFRYTRANWPLTSKAALSGWHCPCYPGFFSMAANLCEPEICSWASKRGGETQKKGRLTIQCDELWSFVDNKGNQQWVWLALDIVRNNIDFGVEQYNTLKIQGKRGSALYRKGIPHF